MLGTEVKKLYYSIGEVSEITTLKPYVLRYWETEFTTLAPSKNRAGNRVYTEDDIKKILDIKRLLYQEKFTIEGARQFFKNHHLPAKRDNSVTDVVGKSTGASVMEKEIARKALVGVQDRLSDLMTLIRKHK